MSQSAQRVPQPPKPPEFGREFELKLSQIVGVSLLALLVLLALLGVFGQTQANATSEGDLLVLEVTYPSRFRYKTTDSIEVRARNSSSVTLPAVTVRFDRTYIDSFSAVQFTPSVSAIADDAYEVTLRDIPAGEAKYVRVEVQAEQYWRHDGFIEAEADGDSSRAILSTFVYP